MNPSSYGGVYVLLLLLKKLLGKIYMRTNEKIKKNSRIDMFDAGVSYWNMRK